MEEIERQKFTSFGRPTTSPPKHVPRPQSGKGQERQSKHSNDIRESMYFDETINQRVMDDELEGVQSGVLGDSD